MLVFGSHFRNTSLRAVLFLIPALAGCGNSCFVGFSNNGTGVVIVKVSNPPPSCSLNQVNGMVRVIAIKSAVCETCSTTMPHEQLFLTVRGIQLQSADAQTTPAWLEIAPQLAKEPRQIDLTAPHPNVLVEQAMIPSGNYRALRLQFLSASPAPNQSPAIANACNSQGWNCVVSVDGQVEPLRQADLVMNLNSSARVPFLLLPDTSVDLQIDLGAAPTGLYFSEATGVRPQTVISGYVVMVPQGAAAQQPVNSD